MSIVPNGSAQSVPCPPRRPCAFLPILGLKGGTTYRFTILSSQMYGRYLHYVGERTVWCNSPDTSCERCNAGLRQRWYGFLAVLDTSRKVWLIQLTTGAVQHCPALEDRTKDLRSRRIEVARLRDHSNSPMRVSLLDGVFPVAGFPEPNLLVAVRRLFDWVDLTQQSAEATRPSSSTRAKTRKGGK